MIHSKLIESIIYNVVQYSEKEAFKSIPNINLLNYLCRLLSDKQKLALPLLFKGRVG
jgi:hypothetical protein